MMARTRGGGADTVRSDENGLIAVLAFGGVVTQSALPGAFGFGSDHFPYF